MNLNNLTTEEREQLEQYARSVKEITNEINSLLEKCGYKLKKESRVINPNNNKNNRSDNLHLDPNGEPKSNEPNPVVNEHKRVCANKNEAQSLIDKLEEVFPGIEINRKLNENGKYSVKFWL
jgi:hypothetical protein